MKNQIEYYATAAGVIIVGVLVTQGWLNREFGGFALGALLGSGARSAISTVVASKTPPAE